MLRINITQTKRLMSEMGIGMSLISIPLGMIVKIILGNMLFGNLLMAVGLVLMFPYHRIKEGIKLNLLTGVILFIILAFIYYFLSDFDEPVYLIYIGVSLIFSMGISLSKYEVDFSFDKTILFIWLFSLVTVLGGLYCFASGTLTIFSGMFDFNEEGDAIYDGLTMGSVCITQMISSFYFISKKEISSTKRICLFLLIIIDFVVTIMAFKRTPLLIATLVIFYYLRRLGYLSMTPKKVFGILMVILIAVIYVLNNNEVKEAVESIVEYTYEGISNLITGNHTGHGLTNSTDMRIDNRDQALNMIAQFDILEYMLGKGFMTFWFDMPLLQSYLDMGVIGFLLFFSYTVILPFYAVFSKNKKNDLVLFCGMLAVPSAICSLTSGHPYFHSIWMHISLLCFVLNANYENNSKKHINNKKDSIINSTYRAQNEAYKIEKTKKMGEVDE